MGTPRFNLKTEELLSIESVGPSDKPADAIILCQHGADGVKFIDQHKQALEEVCTATISQLKRYCYIEHDWPLHPLADRLVEIAKEAPEQADQTVQDMVADMRIILIKHGFPRGIVDTNRSRIDVALRKIIKPSEYFAVLSELAPVYAELMGRTRAIIDQTLNSNPQATVLNLHTMRPFNSLYVDQKHEGIELADHNVPMWSEYLNGHGYRISRREICMINSYQNDVEATHRRDNMELSHLITRRFTQEGLSYQFNVPYGIIDGTKDSVYEIEHLLIDHPGRFVVIDFTRDNFSQLAAEDPSFDLANLTIDQGKLDLIAKILADAIREHYLTGKGLSDPTHTSDLKLLSPDV